MFPTVSLSIISNFSLYTQQWYMSYRFADGVPSWSCSQAVSKPVWHTPLLCRQWKTIYRFADSLRAGPERSVLILFASRQQTCMTYTISVCTVKNSWRWTEELSETCRILFPKKIWEIIASIWFYYKILKFSIP